MINDCITQTGFKFPSDTVLDIDEMKQELSEHDRNTGRILSRWLTLKCRLQTSVEYTFP